MRAPAPTETIQEGAERGEVAPPRPLHVGLLGCGAVARLYYAPTLRALEREGEIRVHALLDPDPLALAELARSFPAATAMQGLDEMPTGALDLGIVASPPRFHAQQAVHLLRAGVPVLCEKPMAESYADAVAMVEAAESTGRMLAIAMVRRFLPATGFIRRTLAEGVLGERVHCACREGGPFRWPVRSPAFFHGRGGGVLLDVGVHVLDLLTWWFGPPEEVRYADDAMGGAEANCGIHLRFPGGVTSEVRLSRDTPQPNRYVLRGERGWMTWDLHEPDGLRLGYHGAGHALDARLREVRGGGEATDPGGSPGGFLEAFAAQLRNAVASLRGTARAAVTGREALQTMRLLEECRARRSLLPMPWLGEAEQREALRLSGDAP